MGEYLVKLKVDGGELEEILKDLKQAEELARRCYCKLGLIGELEEVKTEAVSDD